MPTITVAAQLSPSDLLQAVRQLNSDELDRFVSEVLSEQNRRHAPALDRSETELPEVINQGRPEEEQRRFNELKVRLREKTMTPEEQAEFLRITDEREKQNARRIEALAALAKHREVPILQLMEQLGINTPPYE